MPRPNNPVCTDLLYFISMAVQLFSIVILAGLLEELPPCNVNKHKCSLSISINDFAM